MKKILITGVNSYVGNSVGSWLSKYPEKYTVDYISLRDEAWKNEDFSKYHVILHVAGIAHVSSDPRMKDLYYKVNRDLTIEVAEKAKSEGVDQFIFMSSIIVYGKPNNPDGLIDRNTIPKPDNFYGDSKLQAEEGLRRLSSPEFKVAILRPPMIYGKGCKGNYPRLAKLARLLPAFPDYDNKRSMLHIDNLCEFIRLVIDNEETGLFCPQNLEYVKTSEMVRLIAACHGRRVVLWNRLKGPIQVLLPKSALLSKVFGSLYYASTLSEYPVRYQVRSLQESVRLSEMGEDSLRFSGGEVGFCALKGPTRNDK